MASNSFAQDKMMTMFEEVLPDTGNGCTLSKMIDKRKTSELEQQRSADTQYVNQKYRFETGNGIVTTDGDAQAAIQRMVPINLNNAINAVVKIETKELRDPYNVSRIVKGVQEALDNKIDLYTYQKMLEGAAMTSVSAGAMSPTDITNIDNKFDGRGYKGYQSRKAFYSQNDYTSLADTFAQKTYDAKRTTDAIEQSRLASVVGRFDSYKADYNMQLTACKAAAKAITVTANTKHTVSTYTNSDKNVYKDHRAGTIALTGLAAGDLKPGDSFTIANVGALNEEVRLPTGALQEFVVRSVVTDGSVYEIAPAIVVDGPYRNCTAQAAANAAVTILNKRDAAPSLFFLPESTIIVPGVLPATDDGITVATGVTGQGLPMRLTKHYDQHKEELTLKWLVYFDVQVIQNEMINKHLSKQA